MVVCIDSAKKSVSRFLIGFGFISLSLAAFGDDVVKFASVKPTEDSKASVYLDPEGGVYFKTADGNFVSYITGYVQAAGVDFSGNTNDTVNNNSAQNFHSSFVIPDTRLELGGSVVHDWKYAFSYDFTFHTMAEAYIGYTGFKNTGLEIGQFKSDFGSVGNITTRTNRAFLYDALPVIAFVPSFLLGVQGRYDWEQIGISLGVVVPPTGNYQQDSLSLGNSSNPVGTTARLSYKFKRDESHLAFAALENFFTQSVQRNSAQFQALPEMRARDSAYLVQTPVINSSYFDVPALEVAGVDGPFSIDGGYYAAAVNQKQNSTLFFDGADVEAGYFFTGEHRQFRLNRGEFTTISPVKHGYGAWQIAGRLSYLNLNSDNISGGREMNESIGFNWYPKNRLKLGLEYIYGNASPSANGLNRHMNMVSLMGQVQL